MKAIAEELGLVVIDIDKLRGPVWPPIKSI
jgi:hypothetical protein